jgi:4'-phosphopantetheinyl transferase
LLLVLRGTPALLAEAEASLSSSEADQLRGLKVEKRRRDWLLGRLAAKRAAAGLLGDARPLTRLAVEASPEGAPRMRDADTGAPGPAISISHSTGCAAALASYEPAGVDLEALQPMPAGAERYYLSPSERQWLAEVPWGPHGELAAWALKEAAYKALSGAPRALTHLALEPAPPPAAWVWLSHEGVRLRARWAIGGGFCLAVATAGPAPGLLERLGLEAALTTL